MPKSKHVDVLILGAGIGGYEAYRTLASERKRKNMPLSLLLVDKNSYFTFTPLLHEVASGAVDHSQAIISIRELIDDPKDFLLGEVLRIDPEKKIVQTNKGTISYGRCIVALGSGVQFYNTPGAKNHSYTVRTAKDALSLKHKLFHLMNENKASISLTVVGGGYTGIEVALQMSSFFHKEGAKLFPDKKFSISIVEPGAGLAKYLPEKAQQKILAEMKREMIKTYLSSRVTKVEHDRVEILSKEKKKTIASDMTIWTAGCENIAEKFLEKRFTEFGRIPVNEYLEHPLAEDLFAIGDITLSYSCNGALAPQLGEVAHKQGMYIGKQIIRKIRGKKRAPFHITLHGTLMPLGDWNGIAVFHGITFSGRFAWWLRRTAYVLFFPGFVRKIKIVLDWTVRTLGYKPTTDVDLRS